MIGFTVVMPSPFGWVAVAVYARDAWAAKVCARIVFEIAVMA